MNWKKLLAKYALEFARYLLTKELAKQRDKGPMTQGDLSILRSRVNAHLAVDQLKHGMALQKWENNR